MEQISKPPPGLFLPAFHHSTSVVCCGVKTSNLDGSLFIHLRFPRIQSCMPMNRYMSCYLCVGIAVLAAGWIARASAEEIDFFPAVTQFSPVPAGPGWHGEEGPLSEEILRATVDNLWEHGFRGIQVPTHRPAEEEAVILAYARSKGMIFTYEVGALELFGRSEPPQPCVYSPDRARRRPRRRPAGAGAAAEPDRCLQRPDLPGRALSCRSAIVWLQRGGEGGIRTAVWLCLAARFGEHSGRCTQVGRRA